MRKIVQVFCDITLRSTDSEYYLERDLCVLCDDQSIWWLDQGRYWKEFTLPPLPGNQNNE